MSDSPRYANGQPGSVMWVARMLATATSRRSALGPGRGQPRRRPTRTASDRLRDPRGRPRRRAGTAARSSCLPSAVPSRRSLRSSALLPVDSPLELLLVHPRAAFDVQVLGLVVELVARPALLAVGARPLSPALARRLRVADRRPRTAARLAGARTLLVDRAGGDLLSRALGLALVLDGFLDVLVLPGAL